MPPTRTFVLFPLISIATLSLPAQNAKDPTPAVTTAPGSSEAATPEIPTLRVTTRIVVLDVVVTDAHGHPVTGLKRSDFDLTEDGAPQIINSFTEHNAITPTPPQPTPVSALPPNTFAVQPPVTGNGASAVIVLGNVSRDHAPFVRDQLKEFLATSPIGIPIAIFRQDWQGMHLVQGLTLDRNLLLDAASSQRILPPLGFRVRYARSITPPAIALVRYLAAIPGRINLVWFGEAPPSGNDDGLFPDLDGHIPPDLAAVMNITGAEASMHRLSRIAVYPILAGGLVAPAPCKTQACVENVAQHAGGGSAMCQAIMEAAIDAGGKAFCNTNGFKEALTDVETTATDYYTISYRPTNPNWNGKYRTIHIVYVPQAQESVGGKMADWVVLGPAFFRSNLTYRHGYYARDSPPPPIPESPGIPSGGSYPSASAAPQRKLISLSPRGADLRTPMERAMAFGTLIPDQVHFTIAVTPSSQTETLKPNQPLPPENFITPPFRSTLYRNTRIHYWIDPQDLHFTLTPSGAYRADLQFVAMVYRDDGLVANSISYTSHIQVAADQLEDVQSNGLTYDQTIAIPVPGNPLPGQFFLRAGVADLVNNRIGALQVPVESIKMSPAPNPPPPSTPGN